MDNRRNAPCPCGSGKRYKHCHGRLQHQARGVPPEILSALAEHQRRETARQNLFGLGRPLVTFADQAHGYRFVAVGGELHWSPRWKTFHDFLLYYIKRALTPEFGNEELAKPLSERHPILQWHQHVCDHQRRTITQPREPVRAISTGPAQSYVSLAYDLFTVAQNATLHARLLKRLRNKDQFHGASHELKVIASFIRAGFDIAFENERDGTTTHCEFSALHRASGAYYSVEAKARHRKGILGQAGETSDAAAFRANVGRHIQQALLKRAIHPRIIVVDVNMPPSDTRLPRWLDDVMKEVAWIEQRERPADPYPPAFLFFTNHPYHFVEPDTPSPHSDATVFRAFKMPEFVSDLLDGLHRHPAVEAFLNSLQTHTVIPPGFPDRG
jgi:SEC-C motif